MDSSVTTNPLGQEFHVTSESDSYFKPHVDVSITVVPPNDRDDASTIIIDPSSDNNDLTVTPAFPSFPTDEEVVIKPESIIMLEPMTDDSTSEPGPDPHSLPTITRQLSQQKLQLLDELKYLLVKTNSLSTPEAPVQTSQEADSARNYRSNTLDEGAVHQTNRLLIEGLTPAEAKSLGAAHRRSMTSRSQRTSLLPESFDQPRARSISSPKERLSYSQYPPTVLIAQPEHRTFLHHLSGLIWAFLAAYAFSGILFITKICGIDLIFGFFIQMIVQTIAFAIYAFYKGYNLLGPTNHRLAMIFRGLLIGIGVLTSFLAYYYVTLPDLSAIRQSQVIFTVILSMFIFHERITVIRILAAISTIVGIVVLMRPTTFGASPPAIFNSTDYKTFWVPYPTQRNSIIGIGLAFCTAVTYSIASTMNKMYFSTQHLHNTVLCFWSALSALVISTILLSMTHFVQKDARSFPHDWRLFLSVALALGSIFVFIANQKAIKRERSSIVTLIYSTDIILALILQNSFTHIRSDAIVIAGCVLILVAIIIICVEVLVAEARKKTLAIKVAEVAGCHADDIGGSLHSKAPEKRLSL